MFSLVQTILTFSGTAQAENSRNQEKGEGRRVINSHVRYIVYYIQALYPYILTTDPRDDRRTAAKKIVHERARQWFLEAVA